MDDLVKLSGVFRGRRVLVTGDTGFKGSWLSLWLHSLGAEVYGYALAPRLSNDHFNALGLRSVITHRDGDIRELERLKDFFGVARPEFVFHLAAQALVRRSYADPKETFDTNVGGSVNLLECVRCTPSVRSLVYVTSDKCYENYEWVWGYRETDRLGGRDPYSASKAAAELLFSAYQSSYFDARDECGVASVRAGNVIGGGDWSEDRIVPDCIRSLSQSRPVILRRPGATRPWQHVLEPLSGYLMLAEKMFDEPKKYSGSWNFGPRTEASRSVEDLAREVTDAWGEDKTAIQVLSSANDPHEAGLLRLNCDKAELQLNWRPRWGFVRTVRETVGWYKAVMSGRKAQEVTQSQIISYQESGND